MNRVNELPRLNWIFEAGVTETVIDMHGPNELCSGLIVHCGIRDGGTGTPQGGHIFEGNFITEISPEAGQEHIM
jgi:hypothetical protein